MDSSSKNILTNSTLAFVSAFIITTFLHESGHYLSYWLCGGNPTLFHNYVLTGDEPLGTAAIVISALAGPLTSLVQGLIFGMTVSKSRKNNMRHLLFLWLSLLGYVNFFGYLGMTPLSTRGDTGKVAELLNIDSSMRILIAIVGFIALVFFILKTARNFSNFIPENQDLNKRARYVYCLMFFPIIIGSLFNTALAFPAVSFLSIVYPATSPYVIMSSFNVILKSSSSAASPPGFENKIMVPMVLLAMCAIILNRLLTLGVG